MDLNQQCSKATGLQPAALPIPLTDPFIRLGRSNRKLPFSVFFIKVQFPLKLSACLSSNRPCSHSFLINIPVRFVKLLLAPADRIELPPRESESLVLPLYEVGIKQDAFFILLWANKICVIAVCVFSWCGRRDSNSYEGVPHGILSPRCLPIPPRPQVLTVNNIFFGWATDFETYENIVVTSHISDKIEFYGISVKSLNVIFILFNDF